MGVAIVRIALWNVIFSAALINGAAACECPYKWDGAIPSEKMGQFLLDNGFSVTKTCIKNVGKIVNDKAGNGAFSVKIKKPSIELSKTPKTVTITLTGCSDATLRASNLLNLFKKKKMTAPIIYLQNLGPRKLIALSCLQPDLNEQWNSLLFKPESDDAYKKLEICEPIRNKWSKS